MTHHTRARRHGLAAASTAIAASLATAAGALAATSAPAVADPVPTTTTTTAMGTAPAVTVPTVPPMPESRRLEWVKRDSNRLIANRVESLQTAIRRLADKSYLGQDGTTLTTGMQTDITGLQTLRTKIDGDTDLQTAIADRALIFTQYRIYYLVLPVAADVVNVDWLTAVRLPSLQQQITRVQGLENSANQAYLAPLVSGMQAMAQQITTATNGLSAQLLSYTPAQWNANHNLLFTADAGIRTARAALATAEKDYTQAMKYLRGRRPVDPRPVGPRPVDPHQAGHHKGR